MEKNVSKEGCMLINKVLISKDITTRNYNKLKTGYSLTLN
jgi:hypothetical protein